MTGISYTAAIEACRGLDPDIAAQTALELLQTCDAGDRWRVDFR
jgi:hypothetical protein